MERLYAIRLVNILYLLLNFCLFLYFILSSFILFQLCSIYACIYLSSIPLLSILLCSYFIYCTYLYLSLVKFFSFFYILVCSAPIYFSFIYCSSQFVLSVSLIYCNQFIFLSFGCFKFYLLISHSYNSVVQFVAYQQLSSVCSLSIAQQFILQFIYCIYVLCSYISLFTYTLDSFSH